MCSCPLQSLEPHPAHTWDHVHLWIDLLSEAVPRAIAKSHLSLYTQPPAWHGSSNSVAEVTLCILWPCLQPGPSTQWVRPKSRRHTRFLTQPILQDCFDMTVTITSIATLQVPHIPAASPVLPIAHFESWRLLPEPLNSEGSTVTQRWFTRPWLLLGASQPPCSRSHVPVVLPNGLLPLGQGSNHLAWVRA